MLPMDYTGETTNAAGWTCPICNRWISINSFHVCGGNLYPLSDGATVDVIKDVGLHVKLDEIIELLKKILKE